MFEAIANAYVNGVIPYLAAGSSGLGSAFLIAGFVLTALVAYTLGSLNFALILSKRMYGKKKILSGFRFSWTNLLRNVFLRNRTKT